MEKFHLYSDGEKFYRYLGSAGEHIRQAYVHDCLKEQSMYIDESQIENFNEVSEDVLLARKEITMPVFNNLESLQQTIANQRFNLLNSILPYLDNTVLRVGLIKDISKKNKVTEHTIRKYLNRYLTYFNKSSLVPYKRIQERELTSDEKNFRWALNKFYYDSKKPSLKLTYELMLKEKYTNENGKLFEEYPKFHQFEYFYKKTKKLANTLISRSGLTNYQRNNRILSGHINDYAPYPGLGMIDATTLDIYLINDSGELVGRPYCYLLVDAFSSMILSYSLCWESGINGIRKLLDTCLSDKVDYCKKYGINISNDSWKVDKLPSRIMSDRGSEFYSSNDYSNLTGLGVELVYAPSYRAEVKGPVEKAFDLVQSRIRALLQNKGVVNKDFNQRGSIDYRRGACLTLEQFEKIFIEAVLYYNNSRIVKLSYIDNAGITPTASSIFNYYVKESGDSFISISKEVLRLTLLPRSRGKLTRRGVELFGLRYFCKGSNSMLLNGSGETRMFAYNPEDVSYIWLIDNGNYVKFSLIDSVHKGKTMREVNGFRREKAASIKRFERAALQGSIDFINSVENTAKPLVNTHIQTKHVKETRKKEIAKERRNLRK